MAIQQVARAKSLAWTAVAGQTPTPPTSPLSNVQSYSTSRGGELAEFLRGTSRVNSHYRGTETGSIQVETADIATWAGFAVGQKFTNVILTLEGAKDSSGASVGDDITVTLSEAVVSEVGELAAGNENSAPVVASVTFVLSKHAGSTNDPTMTIAVAGA
ncbi:hypothetical protein GC173_08140 [bacterium]|nr:hypothetical protein [bacterium]